MGFSLELATPLDAEAICDLLNRAYRGEAGWTTENAWVSGERCVVADMKAAINAKESCFLVCKQAAELIACISLEKKEEVVSIGSFAVNPTLQAQGLGKKVLHEAEQFAIARFKPKNFIMSVLSVRTELIEFYQRRGYALSGHSHAYPLHLNVGSPKVTDLTVESLTKSAKRVG